MTSAPAVLPLLAATSRNAINAHIVSSPITLGDHPKPAIEDQLKTGQ
jgi:hypothetical protein